MNVTMKFCNECEGKTEHKYFWGHESKKRLYVCLVCHPEHIEYANVPIGQFERDGDRFCPQCKSNNSTIISYEDYDSCGKCGKQLPKK